MRQKLQGILLCIRNARDILSLVVLDYRKEWLELSSEGFLRKYFVDECNRFDEDLKKIINRVYKFTSEVWDPKVLKSESKDFREENESWRGNIYYKNQREAGEDLVLKEIPIENIPEVFYEIYNFSLIPDSFWA